MGFQGCYCHRDVINNFAKFTYYVQYNNVKNKTGRLLNLVFSNIDCDVTHNVNFIVSEDSYYPSLSR